MENKRGLELALSTVIVIVIVILVLVGITYVLTDGFKKFRSATSPFLSTTEAVAIRQVCENACTIDDSRAFCMKYPWNGKDGKVIAGGANCAKVMEDYGLAECEKISCP